MPRLATLTIALSLMAGAASAAAFRDDVLTDADYSYLTSIGIKQDDNHLRCGVVGEERQKLHALIADAALDARAKVQQVVNLIDLAADNHAYDEIHNPNGGDPPDENVGCSRYSLVAP